MRHVLAFLRPRFLFPFLAANTLPPALLAQATDVMFIDGGFTEICTSAAFRADDPSAVQLTGSRLAMDPVEICTMAIGSPEATPPQRAASYNNRGVLYFTDGKIEESLRDFEAAVGLDPALGTAYVNRGYVLMALKRFEDSIAAFDQGLALGVTDPERAYFNRGIAHEESGHVREAYYDYRKASELKPDWEEPLRELQRFSVRTR
ncbi:MAG: tetratricopeptide repeat protein [Pseudohongiellaceae bacterium]|jgi:tetratricopeptide (TPR) repeat protein